MSDRCEPPEHLRGVDGWHLLQYRSRLSRPTRDIAAFWHARDGQPVWNAEGRVLMPDDAHYADWHYVGQMATPAEVEALRRERDAADIEMGLASMREMDLRARVATLEAANARLREALGLLLGAFAAQVRRIPSHHQIVAITVNNQRHVVDDILDKARAALKEPTP